MTRRDTFTNLSDVWAKELELYSTNQDCIKMLVGNKVDRVSPFPYVSCHQFRPHFTPARIFRVMSSSLFSLGLLFQEGEQVVSREEGLTLAKELGCLFLECSAKTRTNVEQCFEELALKVKNCILFFHFYGRNCYKRLE